MCERGNGGLAQILCITNRHLAAEAAGIRAANSADGQAAFLVQLRRVAAAHPRAILLREKDLDEADYRTLAREALALCRSADVPCVIHTYPAVARELGADGLHLPLPVLRTLPEAMRGRFPVLGASCHSVTDVREAMMLGCSYVTVGHIYATACKRGVPPRGLDLLRAAVQAAKIPVYAIGGVTRARLQDVLAAGAAGACVMSGLMQRDPFAW